MNREKLAVVYARYSSHRQGEQSIEGQLAAAYKYARENGYKIIHEYIDRAMTGRNDNREAFQEMLKDCAKKQFSTIIVWKIDRFGRNREEIAFNKYRAKKNGVRVVYVAESIPDSPEGVILESVLEGMAEYYSLQLSQNIRRGQRASAEKCQSTGGNRPLGYLTDPETKRFVIDPETAPTVRLIFERYAQGKTVVEIVDELNGMGLRTKRGDPFTKSSLRKILKNEKYVGVYAYKDFVRVEDGVPPIIDKALFDEVQKMLAVNKRAPARKWSKMEYLLTDKLFCGKCGNKMVGESGTGKSGRKYNYYACSARKHTHSCDKKAVKQAWIEELVVNTVVELLSDEKNIEFIANAVWEYYNKSDDSAALETELKTRLKDIEKATANLLKAIEAGIINDATKKRMDELDEQRAEIEAELAAHDLSKAVTISKDYILFYLHELRNGDLTNPEYQKRLVDTFVNSIFLYDDKTVITFNFSKDSTPITYTDLTTAEEENEEFERCALCSTKAYTSEHSIIQIAVLRNVFVLTLRTNQD